MILWLIARLNVGRTRMKGEIRSPALLVFLILVGAGPVWANNPPVVSNVIANQRPDASKLVDIYYNLADADGDACTVWVRVSEDGGTTFAVPALTFTGAVGPGITPGSGKHIIWDAGASGRHPGRLQDSFTGP
jgi:hypothetical protein